MSTKTRKSPKVRIAMYNVYNYYRKEDKSFGNTEKNEVDNFLISRKKKVKFSTCYPKVK